MKKGGPLKIMLLSFFPLILGTSAFGSSSGAIDRADISVEKSIELPSGQGRVHLLIRTDGHAMGAEHLIQLRPLCGQEPWRRVRPKVNESFCEILPQSLKYDPSKNEIQIEARDPDSEAYNRDTLRDPENAVVRCLGDTRKVVYSLEKFCGLD